MMQPFSSKRFYVQWKDTTAAWTTRTWKQTRKTTLDMNLTILRNSDVGMQLSGKKKKEEKNQGTLHNYRLQTTHLWVMAFFSRARILGECSTIHFPPTLLFSFFFFFFKVEISSHILIPLFRPGSVHSGTTGWDDCGQIVPDKLRVSSFPDRFPHYAWIAA